MFSLSAPQFAHDRMPNCEIDVLIKYFFFLARKFVPNFPSFLIGALTTTHQGINYLTFDKITPDCWIWIGLCQCLICYSEWLFDISFIIFNMLWYIPILLNFNEVPLESFISAAWFSNLINPNLFQPRYALNYCIWFLLYMVWCPCTLNYYSIYLCIDIAFSSRQPMRGLETLVRMLM